MGEVNKKLRNKIKTTAYARFFSARRYSKLNNYSLFALSTSAFALIFITLLQKYSCNSVYTAPVLELYQLMSSIFIAALSLVVAFANYGIKAFQMLKSGEDINSLVSDVELNNNKELEIIERFTIYKERSINHEYFEYEYGRRDRKREEFNAICSCNSKVSFWSGVQYFSPLIVYGFISLFFFSSFTYTLMTYYFEFISGDISSICSNMSGV